MAYVTAAEVARYAGLENAKDAQLGLCEELAIQASDEFDRRTGTWHEPRKVRVTTQAAHHGQQELLLPAQVLTLVSVEVDGTDVLVDVAARGDRLVYRTAGVAWSTAVGAIVVVAVLGRRPIPPAVNLAVREMAAIYGGFKTRTFIQGDGIERSTLQTEFPGWVDERIAAMRVGRFIVQDWIIERVA